MSEALHLDWESFGTVDLQKAGLHVYAQHKHTGVWCGAYAFGDEPVQNWFPGQPCPPRVRQHIENGGEVWGHNVIFEIELNNHVAVKKHGWPALKTEQCHCTMTLGYAMSLPGALENIAPALGIDEEKDQKGRRVMLQLSQPRSYDADGEPVWYTPESHPEKFQVLYAYNRQDVEVERALVPRLLPLSAAEREMWLLDAKINNRGVQVDIAAVKKAKAIVEFEKKRLDEAIKKATKNVVATCNEAKRITDWLRWRGVDVSGVAKSDVVELLADPTLPDDCRTVLKLRQEAAKSSTAKLDAMLQGVCEDGRIRGMFQYHGAATGRWAGRRAQPQNYPRSLLPQSEVNEIFDLLGAA